MPLVAVGGGPIEALDRLLLMKRQGIPAQADETSEGMISDSGSAPDRGGT
jgi:hypothetical protein